jgi:hypothetical protein
MSLQVQSAGSASQVGIDGGPIAGRVASLAPSLLPEPGAAGMSGTQDALSMMYSLVAQEGQLTLAIGENAVQSTKRDQDVQLDREKHAIEKQIHAEADAGGFWNDLLSVAEDVAKVAGLIVGVAAAAVATVFTGGTAGIAIVAVAAVLISSGALVSATHCLGKDSAYFGMGMEVVGSVLTMGAASGAVASSAVGQVTQAVSTTAQATEGTATVLAGVSSIEVGKFQSESEDDGADVQQALDAISQQSRMMDELILGLKSSQASNENALQIIAGAAHTCDQTLTTAASGGRA